MGPQIYDLLFSFLSLSFVQDVIHAVAISHTIVIAVDVTLSPLPHLTHTLFISCLSLYMTELELYIILEDAQQWD